MHWTLRLSDYLLTDAIAWWDEMDALLEYLAHFEVVSSQSDFLRVVEKQTKSIVDPPDDDRLPDEIEQCESKFMWACDSLNGSVRYDVLNQIEESLAYRFSAPTKIRELLIGPLCCSEKKVLRLHRLVFELGELLDQCVRPAFKEQQVVSVMTFFYPLRRELTENRPERPEELVDDNCSAEEKMTVQNKYEEDVKLWELQRQSYRDQVREELNEFLDRFIADECQVSSLARKKIQVRLGRVRRSTGLFQYSVEDNWREVTRWQFLFLS